MQEIIKLCKRLSKKLINSMEKISYKLGEIYFYIDYEGIHKGTNNISDFCRFNLKSGNCFRTREEAQKKYEEIMGREV